MPKQTKTKSSKNYWFVRKLSSRMQGLLVVALVAIGGSIFFFASHAATPPYVGIGGFSNQGYWTVGQDGGVFTEGDAVFHGSIGGTHTATNPVVGMAVTPDKGGYWLTDRTGQVYAFGDAKKVGSLPDTFPSAHIGNIVGIAAGPNDSSYWLVGSDGGVFNFGVKQYCSYGNTHLSAPVVGIVSTADAGGFWLAAADGGVFACGDAPFKGSLGGKTLAAPISGIARAGTSNNYWLVGQDGGVFTFGSGFYGTPSGIKLNGAVMGIASTSDGAGYWLVGADGGVFSYGDAVFKGTPPQTTPTCGAGYKGTYPNCTKLTCADVGAGYTGTYPTCKAPAPVPAPTSSSTSGSKGSVAGTIGDGCGINATHYGIDGKTQLSGSTPGGICGCTNGSPAVPYDINHPYASNQVNKGCGSSAGGGSGAKGGMPKHNTNGTFSLCGVTGAPAACLSGSLANGGGATQGKVSCDSTASDPNCAQTFEQVYVYFAKQTKASNAAQLESAANFAANMLGDYLSW